MVFFKKIANIFAQNLHIDPMMITIFCNFWQFSAKKNSFFSKTNVMFKLWHTLAYFELKMPFFDKTFGEI
jgi:hypothetical protein